MGVDSFYLEVLMKVLMLAVTLILFGCTATDSSFLKIKYSCNGKDAVFERETYHPKIYCGEDFSHALTELLRACGSLEVYESFCGYRE